MAYLDVTADALSFGSYVAVSPARTAAPHRLNGAERGAVMLARSDRASSLQGTGYLDKLFEVAFGIRRPNKLADIRLETLRRFAIAIAHERTRLIEWERDELRLLRFTESQIAEAAGLAAQFRRLRSTGGWIHAVFALLFVASFLGIRHSLGDAMIAFVTAAVVAVPLWATFAPRNRAPSPRT